jgi:5'-nucleotidase
MRILITNDDGIQGEGLLHLTKWAQTLGEVVVAAPMVEQSAKSHTIEIHKPFRAEQVDYLPGVTAWAVDSSPADCVRLMVLGKGEKFDLVLSGINRGLNVGTDIMYSGTVAAVFESAALGLPAIAVSTEPKAISTAWQQLDRIWAYFQENKLLEAHSLYNVNIPDNAGNIRITTMGGPYYSDDFLPEEGSFYRPQGKPVYRFANAENLDTESVLTRHEISIMPLTTLRVDGAAYEKLKVLNQY